MQEESTQHQISIQPPAPIRAARFEMGSATSPTGEEIIANSQSLMRNGKSWLPVMGEFHYARTPASQWRTELLKIKAGGIGIVATYVFWIHHEEIQGTWDWSERRNLREFITLCGEVGLFAVVRLGPWCHGEVRNGGFPDWLVHSGIELRSDDARYLAHTRRLFGEISSQINGLLWKDGGPVIGVQCENEYGGPAEHLLSLKRIAVEAGLDVPLYTRTGWPDLSSPMPPGEFFPLFGGYPDGFWDRSIAEMPPGYRGAFLFTKTRADGAIATDLLGEREVGESDEDLVYPYFACEIGGGMERSYHRRIRIAPEDIGALGLVKLGSGNNLQGYYMYHGGTNPEGAWSTLQESQATGYWNDMPVKSYDFQAPIGEFGQVRRHYHLLRRMHLFLNDFGHRLAQMQAYLPPHRPSSADDTQSLRWSCRTDGRSGFVFINNYQRLQPMPAKENTQFHLCLPDACVQFPMEPVTIPADTALFWPLHFDMDGVDLVSATAQPLCRLDIDGTPTYVFAETPGIAADFVFDGPGWRVEETSGLVRAVNSRQSVLNVRPSTDIAIRLRHEQGQTRQILLLSHEQSLACWKASLLGQERLFLTRASLTIDDGQIRLHDDDPDALTVALLPAPFQLHVSGGQIEGVADGMFRRFTTPTIFVQTLSITWEQVQSAGPTRTVPMGSQGVAEAPMDADFDQAAVWKIHLPEVSQGSLSLRLRIRYVGDVAQVYHHGTLLTDNFYNGSDFEVGLSTAGSEELILKILPLRNDAPIYLPGDAWPEFDGAQQVASLLGVDVIQEHEAVFCADCHSEARTDIECIDA